MFVPWNRDIAPVDAEKAPRGSFVEQLITPVYDQVVSASAVGRQRGHTFGHGHFEMTIVTHHIGGLSDHGFSRGRAINNWLMKMNQIGAYSDIPITESLYPSFPSANGGAVVDSTSLDGQGNRVTRLSVARADIEPNMYLMNNHRLFFVMSRSADNRSFVLFPSLDLPNGAVLARGISFRGQLTTENPPGAIAYTKGAIENPRLNFTEVV